MLLRSCAPEPRRRQSVRYMLVDSAELRRSRSVHRLVDAGHRQAPNGSPRGVRSTPAAWQLGIVPPHARRTGGWGLPQAVVTRDRPGAPPARRGSVSGAWNEEAPVRSARRAPRAISRSQLRSQGVLALITAGGLPARSLLRPGRPVATAASASAVSAKPRPDWLQLPIDDTHRGQDDASTPVS